MTAPGLLDLARTLDPATGLARRVRTASPTDDNPLWTIAVDIGRSGETRDHPGYDLSWVGAVGLTRSATMPRAAGEAVERYALLPSPLLDGSGLPTVAYDRGIPTDTAESTYRARLVEAGRVRGEVAVPTSEVDYPVVPIPPGRDPSPSGAAAGPTAEFALSAAARELIERDAAMRAWYGSDLIMGIERSTLEGIGPIRRVLAVADRLGVIMVPTLLPTVHPRLRAALTFAVDPQRGTAAAGIAFEHDEGIAVRKSIMESLQVRAVLSPPDGGMAYGGGPITDDSERAAYWASDHGQRAAREWQHRIRAAGGDLRKQTVPDWSPYLGRHARIDLTSRLPEAVRDLGWQSYKIIAPELLPLRMDETRYPHAPFPHPLI